MRNWKTSLAGYLATVAGVLALVSQSLPPKYATLLMVAGQIANGLGNVCSQDATQATHGTP